MPPGEQEAAGLVPVMLFSDFYAGFVAAFVSGVKMALPS
jgi:hypothetical protein